MTKKTVSDAVDYFNGVWPDEKVETLVTTGPKWDGAENLAGHIEPLSRLGSPHIMGTNSWVKLCTRSEFEAEVERRKELEAIQAEAKKTLDEAADFYAGNDRAKALDELTQLGQAMGDYDVEWDGSGLPPVGCECEATYSDKVEWLPFVMGIGFAFVYFGEKWHKKPMDYFDNVEYRPLKTKEEREREESIKAICDMWWEKCGEYSQTLAEALYDAGYRLNKP